eukprot:TRINITY_DN26271_c0_g2_i1.p1 TRINITY_DN26271_c0_g2~~TRINITY_DN26271_c0_g2_i1.p1  ORF type:complete len:314 (-),score=28.70 TRINITY_DN26271_c0_g2_i1:143-994(-)
MALEAGQACYAFFITVCVVLITYGLCQDDVELALAFLVMYSAFFIFVAYRSYRNVEVLRADEAAHLIYSRRQGKTRGLPDKLRGVFWMSTNAAPELLVTFEGEHFDADRRVLNFDSGDIYSWSYSTGVVGWIYWFLLRMSFYYSAELHLVFKDDDYTEADMPLYVCGCCKDGLGCDGCWAPMGMWWTMKQIDENTWDRAIYLYFMPWRRWELGSYILRRVIDEDGNQLPAFADMMTEVETGVLVKGIWAKPLMQIVNGDGSKLADISSSEQEESLMSSVASSC